MSLVNGNKKMGLHVPFGGILKEQHGCLKSLVISWTQNVFNVSFVPSMCPNLTSTTLITFFIWFMQLTSPRGVHEKCAFHPSLIPKLLHDLFVIVQRTSNQCKQSFIQLTHCTLWQAFWWGETQTKLQLCIFRHDIIVNVWLKTWWEFFDKMWGLSKV